MVLKNFCDEYKNEGFLKKDDKWFFFYFYEGTSHEMFLWVKQLHDGLKNLWSFQ